MSAPARPKKSYARPLADLVAGSLGPVLARQGFAGADIVVNWPEIAGEALARRSRPVKLAWPKKRPGSSPEPATLHVRVEGAAALELQHLAPLMVERINSYFGWACVGRLKLEQGPVGRDGRRAEPPKAPSPTAVARAEAAAAGVENEELRAALVRLGAAVIDREAPAGAKS